MRYSGIQQIQQIQQIQLDIVRYKRDIVDTVGYNGYAAKWLDIDLDRYRDIGRYRHRRDTGIYRRNIKKIHSRGVPLYIIYYIINHNKIIMDLKY